MRKGHAVPGGFLVDDDERAVRIVGLPAQAFPVFRQVLPVPAFHDDVNAPCLRLPQACERLLLEGIDQPAVGYRNRDLVHGPADVVDESAHRVFRIEYHCDVGPCVHLAKNLGKVAAPCAGDHVFRAMVRDEFPERVFRFPCLDIPEPSARHGHELAPCACGGDVHQAVERSVLVVGREDPQALRGKALDRVDDDYVSLGPLELVDGCARDVCLELARAKILQHRPYQPNLSGVRRDDGNAAAGIVFGVKRHCQRNHGAQDVEA